MHKIASQKFCQRKGYQRAEKSSDNRKQQSRKEGIQVSCRQVEKLTRYHAYDYLQHLYTDVYRN